MNWKWICCSKVGCPFCYVGQLWAQSRALLCLWVLLGHVCTLSVHTQTRRWPLLAILAVGSTARVLFPLLQLVSDDCLHPCSCGDFVTELESCFFKHCTLLGPTAEGWGSRSRACWAFGASNPVHWDVHPWGSRMDRSYFCSHRDVQKLWCQMAFYGQ